MHEFSLMADLLRKIEQVAAKANSNEVVAIQVKIGALAHISDAHFREHFEDGSRGTIAEGARLDIEISSNMQDPQAQEIVLQSIELAEA